MTCRVPGSPRSSQVTRSETLDIPDRTADGVLPEDFVPGSLDVVCGRGKGYYNRPGNRLMLEIVSKHIGTYRDAATKTAKGQVLETIMQNLRSGGIIFVKQKNKQWIRLTEKEARVKVRHAVREAVTEKEETCRPQLGPVFRAKHSDLLSTQKAHFKQLQAEEECRDRGILDDSNCGKHTSLLSTQQALFAELKQEDCSKGQHNPSHVPASRRTTTRRSSIVSEGSQLDNA